MPDSIISSDCRGALRIKSNGESAYSFERYSQGYLDNIVTSLRNRTLVKYLLHVRLLGVSISYGRFLIDDYHSPAGFMPVWRGKKRKWGENRLREACRCNTSAAKIPKNRPGQPNVITARFSGREYTDASRNSGGPFKAVSVSWEI